MSEVYSAASRVLIWLGPSDSDMERTMTYFAAHDKVKKPSDDPCFKYNKKNREMLLPGIGKLLDKP